MTRRASIAFAVLFVACQNQPPADKAGKPEVKAAPLSPHGDMKSPHGDMTKAPAAAVTVKTREAVNPHAVTPSGKLRDEAVPGLKFKVPEEWVKLPGSSPMRLASYTLPGPGGDAELAVYRFAGGGGDAASNVNRWRTQFTGADGAPLAESAGKVQETARGPLKITLVDLAGTYVAAVTPGAPERYSDPNYRMLAAIIEGSGDPFFFKAVGPVTTMAVWESGFANFGDAFALEMQ